MFNVPSLNDRNGGLETHPTQTTAPKGGFSLSEDRQAENTSTQEVDDDVER